MIDAFKSFWITNGNLPCDLGQRKRLVNFCSLRPIRGDMAKLNGIFKAAVQAGTLLKPIIEEGVKRLTPEQMDQLRARVIAAERYLSDTALETGDCVRKVSKEFEEAGKLGSAWQLIASKIRDYAASPTLSSPELGAIRLILGLVLDLIAEHQRKKAA